MKLRITTPQIALEDIPGRFDIGVKAKSDHVVMIYASENGQRVVEALWPGPTWTSNELFASENPPDWSFTHVRITSLPPETGTTLAQASPHDLGLLVTRRLQYRASAQSAPPHLQVFHSTDDGIETYTVEAREQPIPLGVEYVPTRQSQSAAAVSRAEGVEINDHSS